VESVYRNLIRYLAQKGLLERSGIVDGGLAIAMSRSRNRYILVKQRHGPSFFVKQAMETEAMTAETVAREAEIYRGAFGDERLQPLRALLPAFHLHDAEQGILVTELVTDAENLAAVHGRLDACPPELARRLGEAIAAYHTIRFAEGKPQAAIFPQQPPWILKLHSEADVSGMRRSSAASQLVDALLAAPGLGDRLAALREGWRRDTLIHTDMRWENCLLAPKKAPIEERRLYIVDWELGDIGDASWDVAGMLQAYLNFWIGSIPAEAASDPQALAEQATRPLTTIRPAIAALWEGYIRSSEVYGPDPAPFLERCVGMMAARMLVTAFEMSAWAQRLEGRHALVVQTALNILEDPAAAARDLLGLEAPAALAPEPERKRA
jgi:aminoglycoside phosphotransferase (APT) family kinase protein